LEQLVAEGVQTRVYFARPLGCPPAWHADYVVKVIKTECADDPLALRSLRREAEVGRHTSHPNLVPILEARLDTKPPHLVMPRLEGAPLSSAIERIGQLVIPHALWIARQLAQGLRHLHTQGWIHGDLKPANVIVSREGHATLIDLGFALRPEESLFDRGRPLTGTLHYVAPEMITSATQTSPASDIYSLGVTLFEMLTGRLPFPQNDPARLVEAHLRQTPPSLIGIRHDAPETIDELIRRMMAKNPLRRPTTAEDIVDELTALEIESLESRFPRSRAG
jgi:serine/threonine-protein kinase